MEILKAKGVYIRDNGTLVDLSKKLSLFLNELNDNQVVQLNQLIKKKEVDVMILPPGTLDQIEDVIDQILQLDQSFITQTIDEVPDFEISDENNIENI